MMKVISNAVAEHYGITEDDLFCRTRAVSVRHPRQVAMFLMTKGAFLSCQTVARYFGKHHSTVVHAIQVVRERMTRDENLADDLVALQAKIPAVPVRRVPVRMITPLPQRYNMAELARDFRVSSYAFEPVDAKRLAVSPVELDRMLAEFGTKVARMVAETSMAGD